MSDGFQVDTGVVRAHADVVDDIGAQVELAADAGGEVTPPVWDNAYGVLSQVFPVSTRPLAVTQIAGLKLLANALEDTAGKLRETATAYETADLDSVGKLVDVLERLLGTR